MDSSKSERIAERFNSVVIPPKAEGGDDRAGVLSAVATALATVNRSSPNNSKLKECVEVAP